MKFTQKLENIHQKTGSRLCVGLDPDLAKLPDYLEQECTYEPERVLRFCLDIIEQTKAYCIAYKPNLAFFEALGTSGLEVFQEVIRHIPQTHLCIADAKRGDIGNTASHYAKAFYGQFDVDAITISPLMGKETLIPFLQDESRAVFVLTLTSNPGAQDYFMQKLQNGLTLSEQIAQDLSDLQSSVHGHIGMVIGATKIEFMSNVLKKHSNAHLLIPGVGTQGGDVEQLKQKLKTHKGIGIINVSRNILYASKGKDYASAAGKMAESYAKSLK